MRCVGFEFVIFGFWLVSALNYVCTPMDMEWTLERSLQDELSRNAQDKHILHHLPISSRMVILLNIGGNI